MKKVASLIAVLSIAAATGFGDLIMTAIYDGSASTPKGVELYVTSTGSYLDWELQTQFNADTVWATAYTFDNTVYEAGAFLYISSTPTDPVLLGITNGTSDVIISDASFNMNGDDRVRLVNDAAAVIDQYGVTDVDGTGAAWEYTDSYATRNSGTGPDGGFTIANWTVAPINTLDPGNTPLETALHTYVVPEPATFGLLGLGGLILWFRRRK